ncbi:putative enoyl-CoA hydratase, mitochondrial [Branchiostoma floridae x Branchiostoma japonicum]
MNALKSILRAPTNKLRSVCHRKLSTETTKMNFQTILYTKVGRVAHIALNRPGSLNAITMDMPMELQQAVRAANADDDVRVILLYGKGKAFCSGYDLKQFAEGERGSAPGSQTMPWCPYKDYSQVMHPCTEAFMSLWRSLKPVVCKVHGYAVAGGSDIALCSDIIYMADDALIGYPPSRLWGCPTTAMWVYRVGAEKAKRLLLTGDLIDGQEAARIGLVCKSVPAAELDSETDRLVNRIASVPTNQLFFQKQVINQAVEQMGLASTQRLATIFDGMTRHSPEGVAFQERCREVGFKEAVLERDEGDWGAQGPSSKL